MEKQLLSLPSITALNRIITGHYDGEQRLGLRIDTHAALHDFFEALGIEVAQDVSISKKVRATLKRMNSDPEEHELLRRLIIEVVDPRYYWQLEGHAASIDYLNQNLLQDERQIKEFKDSLRLVSTGLNSVAATALTEKAHVLDLFSVQDDFERAVAETDRDPADAITSACSTVESVCKCILDELGEPYPSKQDVQHLSNEVAKHLNLSPARTDLPLTLAQDLKQILGGLQTVAGGIGALRTHFGDAHGHGKKKAPVDARIAKLAIHSASAVALFYIETWQKLSNSKR